jgi:urea transport system permease protein
MRRAVPDARAARFRASLAAAALLVSAAISPAAQALDRSALAEIALGDASAKQKAIDAAVAAGDAQAAPILMALLEGRLYVEGGKRALIAVGDAWIDPLTQKPPEPPPAEDLEKVSINNRMRRRLELALAALALAAPAPADRLAAAQSLQDSADEAVLPAIDLALRRETDPLVAEALRQAAAVLALSSSDRARRLAAIGQLLRAPSTRNKRLLLQRLGQGENDAAAEKDPAVRAELRRALDSIDASLRLANLAGLVFGGLSLGSILLLAALGLAITFGLMGVINMAHGELLMIGAYATWLVQGVFRRHLPGLFSWYLLAAVPAAFVAAGLVGMLLEVAVVRKLYGRPLETLLATWGASLLLIQAVRTLFGAQNVEVANPPWMSGGVPAMSGLVLPYNRLAILVFAVLVVLAMWLLLTRTRLGLLVRAVTQNRAMAASLGVATPRVDLLAFALGSGLAGLGGCALSQIGNVGPELGQGFIVDSFMVVVLGGVGQLAGTVGAALGLGQVNKLLEPTAGAVMAKIAVLVFVILFIQRRPQGLFAQRGRSSEEGQGE